MKKLDIETGYDGLGDICLSLIPLDIPKYCEITLADIEKDWLMGRNEDAKIKIMISE